MLLTCALKLQGGTDVENVCEKGFYQEDCDYRPVMDKSEVAHGRIVHVAPKQMTSMRRYQCASPKGCTT